MAKHISKYVIGHFQKYFGLFIHVYSLLPIIIDHMNDIILYIIKYDST